MDSFGVAHAVPRGNPRLTAEGPLPDTGAVRLEAEGSTVFLSSPINDSLRITGPITVSVWVNTTESERFGYVVNRFQATDPLRSWAIRVDEGQFNVNTSSDGSRSSAQSQHHFVRIPVNDGQWHHLAFTWDPQNQLRLFLNGEEMMRENLRVERGGSIEQLHDPAVIGIVVGNRSGATVASQFTGMVSEPAIWDQALSPEEIAWLANNSIKSLPRPEVAEIELPDHNIELHQDFDNGSLSVAESFVSHFQGDRPVITVTPRDIPFGGRWVHFEISGVQGMRPIFQLPLGRADRGAHNEDHRYVYSTDGGETFQYFVDAERDDHFFTFSPLAPFPVDTVRVAYSLPYPVSRTAEKMEWVTQSPWVETTPSGDDNFVIGTTLGTERGGYRDELGREIPSLPIFGFSIHQPSSGNDSETVNVVLTSGTHASESTAHFVLEGAIDFLLSNDPTAELLRKNVKFFVYPQLNPEGRWAGYGRSAPEAERRDVNRDWHDEPLHTSVAIAMEAIQRDTGGQAEYLIDFHNHRTGYIELWVNREVPYGPLYSALKEMQPRTIVRYVSNEGNVRSFGSNYLGTSVSITHESGFNAFWRIEAYHELGRDTMRALAAALEL